MARRKRGFDQFSLSFLDAMACGLGAVILIFMIINHASEIEASGDARDVDTELSQLEETVLQKRSAAAKRAAALKKTEAQLQAALREAASLEEIIEQEDDSDQEVQSSEKNIAALEEEIQALQKQLDKLEASAGKGDSSRDVSGDGRRQYLSGLQLDGKRTLILLDSSSSMLGNSILEVLRRRNMKDEQRQAADKWQRALATVDWLSSQIPERASFQLYHFNTKAAAVLAKTQGKWLTASGGTQLNAAVEASRKLRPDKGTSLARAWAVASQLSPKPDSVVIITDGLPTQDASGNVSGTVSGRKRERFFADALRELPGDVPVNVILFPMEGDPMAAPLFWRLAKATGGAFLSPSKDWP